MPVRRDTIKRRRKKGTDHVTKSSKQVLAEAVQEHAFMYTVMSFAQIRGWYVYHTHDSRGSVRGFPDIICLRPPDAPVYAELKRASNVKANQPTKEQCMVLTMLADSGQRVFLWRPTYWHQIEEVLA